MHSLPQLLPLFLLWTENRRDNNRLRCNKLSSLIQSDISSSMRSDTQFNASWLYSDSLSKAPHTTSTTVSDSERFPWSRKKGNAAKSIYQDNNKNITHKVKHTCRGLSSKYFHKSQARRYIKKRNMLYKFFSLFVPFNGQPEFKQGSQECHIVVLHFTIIIPIYNMNL